MKKLLQTAFLSITILSAVAQNGFLNYTQTYTGGIPPLLKETAILVDNIGVKWIGYSSLSSSGSNVGILRHDGVTGTFYNSTFAIPFNSYSVTAIVQDGAGTIWIGSELGLTKFSGGSFVTFNTSNGLPSNYINCIEIVGSLIFVGTNNGLSRYDGISFNNYNVASGTLANDTIKSIKKESSTVLWLGGNKRLTQFNYTMGGLTSSFVTNLISPSTGNINAIYIDALNNKWLGTSLVGVLKYNGSTFTNANTLYEIIGSTIPTKVLDICQGPNNGVAFKTNSIESSQSIGIIELTNDNKIFQYYTNSTTHKIGDYFENQAGNIVTTTQGSGIPNIYTVFNKTNHFTYEASTDAGSGNLVTSNNFKYLDINAVKAGIANRGDMHWDIGGNGVASYEVPKGSGKHTDFANALWIGGLDAASQLHQTTQTYRQGNSEFWPGPLDTTTAIADIMTTNDFDKIWKVSYTDINNLITNFSSGALAAGTFTPANDILSWPGNGTGALAKQLAPYVDFNNDGLYNPYDGDYPKIKGDQALFFIFNNNLPGHAPGCSNMGLEIHGMAYAYGCPASIAGKLELNLTTFYDYKIYNRSTNNYHDMYVGLFIDADLGYYQDDHIGCNVTGNYGYVYNGDNYDETAGGSYGYGSYLPASAHAILKGPKATTGDGIDNDNDGIIDEPDEECKLNKFVYYNNNYPGAFVFTSNPTNCLEGYQYLKGQWKDGTPFTCGGSAYGGSVTTNWAFPGDPTISSVSTDPANLCGYWIDNFTPSDRRFVLSSGPFNLNAGSMTEVEYAVVNSFDSSVVGDNLISVAKLKTDVAKINNFYNLITKPSCLVPITIGVNELLKQTDFYVFPNPATENITIKTDLEGVSKIEYEVFDVLGKTIVKNETHSVTNFTININDFKSGIYFIKLKVNDSFVTKKFIKN